MPHFFIYRKPNLIFLKKLNRNPVRSAAISLPPFRSIRWLSRRHREGFSRTWMRFIIITLSKLPTGKEVEAQSSFWTVTFLHSLSWTRATSIILSERSVATTWLAFRAMALVKYPVPQPNSTAFPKDCASSSFFFDSMQYRLPDHIFAIFVIGFGKPAPEFFFSIFVQRLLLRIRQFKICYTDVTLVGYNMVLGFLSKSSALASQGTLSWNRIGHD